MGKKILYLVAGVVVITLGVLTIFDLDLVLLSCGIMLFVYGFSYLMQWIAGRRSGTSSLWTLFCAALSFILGCGIFIGSVSSLTFSTAVITAIFALWLIAVGVFEILGAIMYRKAMTSADLGVYAPGSKTSIISGGIMILVGLLALLIPIFAMVTAHIWIVMGLILTGVRLITQARTAGELEEIN